jgi:hypothetical protein
LWKIIINLKIIWLVIRFKLKWKKKLYDAIDVKSIRKKRIICCKFAEIKNSTNNISKKKKNYWIIEKRKWIITIFIIRNGIITLLRISTVESQLIQRSKNYNGTNYYLIR